MPGQTKSLNHQPHEKMTRPHRLPRGIAKLGPVLLILLVLIFPSPGLADCQTAFDQAAEYHQAVAKANQAKDYPKARELALKALEKWRAADQACDSTEKKGRIGRLINALNGLIKYIDCLPLAERSASLAKEYAKLKADCPSCPELFEVRQAYVSTLERITQTCDPRSSQRAAQRLAALERKKKADCRAAKTGCRGDLDLADRYIQTGQWMRAGEELTGKAQACRAAGQWCPDYQTPPWLAEADRLLGRVKAELGPEGLRILAARMQMQPDPRQALARIEPIIKTAKLTPGLEAEALLVKGHSLQILAKTGLGFDPKTKDRALEATACLTRALELKPELIQARCIRGQALALLARLAKGDKERKKYAREGLADIEACQKAGE